MQPTYKKSVLALFLSVAASAAVEQGSLRTGSKRSLQEATNEPTMVPSWPPTSAPSTLEPTNLPTGWPTAGPTVGATRQPSSAPSTMEPTSLPTGLPTSAPTKIATLTPTLDPTKEPTVAPTAEPTVAPTGQPTAAPSEFICDLNDAQSTKDALVTFSSNTARCAEQVEELIGVIENAQLYYSARIDVVNYSEQIVEVIEKVDTAIDRVGDALGVVPKVGPIIRKIQTTLHKFKKFPEKIAKHDVENLEKMNDRFDNVTGVLGDFQEKVLQEAEKYSDWSGAALSLALETSENNGCCGSDAINSVAFIENAISLGSSGFDICADVLDTVLPDFPTINLGPLTEIIAVIDEIANWIEGVVGDFMDSVGYETCCNPVLSPIVEFAKGLSNVFNLATCWVDGAIDGVIKESLDVLLPLFDDVVEDINDLIGDHNHYLNRLNDFAIELPKDLFSVSVSFDESTCSFDIEGSGFDPSTTPFSPFDFPNVNTLRFDADGSFDLGSIGKEILNECSEAWDALTTSDGVDCCPAARLSIGIPVEGWGIKHHCNYDGDCASGICEADECTDYSLGTTCNFDHQCDSGRCEGVGPSRCERKLEVCELCNEDDDCLSGNCNRKESSFGLEGVCTFANGKVPDGCQCEYNSDCKSNRCEGSLGSGPYTCKAQLGYGASCNEDSDCRDFCARDKCSDGRLGGTCNHDHECDSGRCDGTCQKKLGSCSTCNEDADCQSGKCLLRSTRSVCALSNGKMADNCFCDRNSHCQSGRCEGSWPPYQCKRKLSKGSSCNESSDCRSNKCQGGFLGINKKCD